MADQARWAAEVRAVAATLNGARAARLTRLADEMDAKRPAPSTPIQDTATTVS